MPLKSFVKEPRSQRRGITSWKVKPELFQWDNPGEMRPRRGRARPRAEGSRRRPVPAVRTCPRITSDTSSGASPARRSTSRMAAAPSSCAGSDDSPPLKDPGRGAQRESAQHPDSRPAPAAASATRRARRCLSPTAVLAADTKTTGSALMAAAAAVGAERSGGGESGAAAAAGAKAESAPVPPLTRPGRGGWMEPEQGIRRRTPEDSAGAGRAVAWPGRPLGRSMGRWWPCPAPSQPLRSRGRREERLRRPGRGCRARSLPCAPRSHTRCLRTAGCQLRLLIYRIKRAGQLSHCGFKDSLFIS